MNAADPTLPVEAAEDAPQFVPGIDYRLPAERYHAIPAIGSGGVKRLLKSAAHFKADYDDPEDEARSVPLEVGEATHMAILEPERFATGVVSEPPDAPKKPTKTQLTAKKPAEDTVRAIAFWREFNELHRGKVVLAPHDYECCMRMGDAVRAHPGARELLAAGAPEVSLQWVDPATGAPCKARIDWLHPSGGAVDLKTARDASKQGFIRAIAQQRYAVQAAHYDRGSFNVLGGPFPFWTFIAVEKTPPFAVGVYELDRPSIAAADVLVGEALDRFATATRTGEWPAYGTTVEVLTLPAWAI